jgi:hypothetical protein
MNYSLKSATAVVLLLGAAACEGALEEPPAGSPEPAITAGSSEAAGPEEPTGKVETVDHETIAKFKAAMDARFGRKAEEGGKDGVEVRRQALSASGYRFALPKKNSYMPCSQGDVVALLDNQDEFDDDDFVNGNQLHLRSLARSFDVANVIPPAINEKNHADFKRFVWAGGIAFPRIGALFGSRELEDRDTQLELCIEHRWDLPPAKHDYAVIALDDACPAGTYWFERYQDAEDDGNITAIWPQNFPGFRKADPGNFWTAFCFVPGTGNPNDPSVPHDFAEKYWVLGPNSDEATYWGILSQDDEDSGNVNNWRSSAPKNLHGRMKQIVSEGRNTMWFFRGSGKGWQPNIRIEAHTDRFWAQTQCVRTRDDKNLAADRALGEETAKNAIEAIEKDKKKAAAQEGGAIATWYFARKEAAMQYQRCMEDTLRGS